MLRDTARSDTTTADVLRWQTNHRIALALIAGAVSVGLRTVGFLHLSPVADAVVGPEMADWYLGLVPVSYAILVIAIRGWVQRQRSAGQALSTLMAVADLVVVFWLVFLLASVENYHLGLFLALFSLQLTHVYFGRAPALLTLAATAAAYLLLNDIADRHGAVIRWGEVLITLAIFGTGALLVTRVQSNLHERLGALVRMFDRAQEGDFGTSYDVSADRRPDAITAVGRAYNRMRTELASIVLTDPLSGCFNRRGFEQQYRRELARAARAQTPLALLAIDLDHFKQVNDTHGHLVGDKVIAGVGELLRASARQDDVVARTGGEEFTILAPNTSLEGAQQLAQRVVEAFHRRPFGDSVNRIPVTVSIGVAADNVRDDGMGEALRARADEALYAAKRTGRNRVVTWSPDPLKSLAAGAPEMPPA
ncbi:MAG: GGDEF domain-containing protein [Gemmatimonadaceae bacterium]|nr:GGDEF domain-containing protein [Gemmatimonadaceae bacterium]